MTTSREHLISLRTNLALASESVASLRYLPSKPSHLAAAALACSSVELGTGIFHLAGCSAKMGLPVLLRSLLESTMRLALIAKDPLYGPLSLELIDNTERLKFGGPEKSDQSLSIYLRARNEELKAAGAKMHSFRDLLTHIDGADWYGSYRVFSAFSHAQLSALAQHFFDRQPESTRVHVNKEPDERLLVTYFSGADQLICITTQAVRLIFSDHT
jgi:hypothetical protein